MPAEPRSQGGVGSRGPRGPAVASTSDGVWWGMAACARCALLESAQSCGCGGRWRFAPRKTDVGECPSECAGHPESCAAFSACILTDNHRECLPGVGTCIMCISCLPPCKPKTMLSLETVPVCTYWYRTFCRIYEDGSHTTASLLGLASTHTHIQVCGVYISPGHCGPIFSCNLRNAAPSEL